VVRRIGLGMGNVPRVLPDDAAPRLRLRGFRHTSLASAHAGSRARRPARREPRRLAHRTGRLLETAGHRESHLSDPGPARRHDRLALFPAFDNEPARAGVVQPAVSGPQSVPPVRIVESRIAACAPRLPVPSRAVDRDARAGVGLVDGLCRVRRARCGGRICEPARACRDRRLIDRCR
jgi:hypothetical protein